MDCIVTTEGHIPKHDQNESLCDKKRVNINYQRYRFRRISPKLQTTIVNTFFDAVLVSDGDKMEIAEACASGAFMDFSVSHRRSS